MTGSCHMSSSGFTALNADQQAMKRFFIVDKTWSIPGRTLINDIERCYQECPCLLWKFG
jgi:hypothetical protein